MDFALFTVSNGLPFVFRWIHFFFGVTWIGLLYYFNFVQGPFFNETDAPTKSNATQKLVPRALWWFRYGALWTMASGIALIGWGQMSGEYNFSGQGIKILIGAIFGLLMGANVWFIIWPNQKVVIANAEATAKGQPANPAAAGAGARALCASRTNVLFSFPMLFFMGANSHLPLNISQEPKTGLFWAVFAVIAGLLELNAIKGKTGPLTTIKGVIHCGLALALGLYVILEVLV